MSDRAEAFLERSAELTGFGRVELHGTAMLDVYLRTVEEAGVLDELLAGGDPASPAAQSLILLWYCGIWEGRVVSGEAYLAGLQWVAAGAHPVGARAQGYGAWAVPPDPVQA